MESPALDDATRRLLDLERRLKEAEQDGTAAAIQAEIRNRLGNETSFVRTSKELDEHVQLALLFITTVVEKVSGWPGRTYKVCLVIHSSRHRVLIIKPSFYYRGRCAALHPAISLASRSEGSGARKLGQTGLSFQLRKPIFCRRFAAQPQCGDYVHVQAHGGEATTASLCVPLTANLTERLAAFCTEDLAAFSEAQACTLACPSSEGERPPMPRAASEGEFPSAVLDIEFHGEPPQPSFCVALLQAGELSECLSRLHSTLVSFRAQRDRYHALKACTSLFDLAHHSLSAREAFELLLRRVSKICDEADVTLHLREMSAPEDEDRAVRLVEGVGADFRGFLINDRQSIVYGLVGNEFRSGEGSNPTVRTRREIEQALRQQSSNYRQLMPATVLNLALAIPETGGGQPLGVLNIEWSAACAIAEDDEEQRKYIEGKLPVLRRIASYFTLIVEHYYTGDEVWAPDEQPLEDRLNYAREQGNRRHSLSYHVGAVLARLRNGEWNADGGRYAYGFLKEIIDAAGYLFSSERKLQFYLSCRRLAGETVGGGRLVMAVEPHGMKVDSSGADGTEEKPGDPIPIPAGAVQRFASVMAAAARAGVPVSGELRPVGDGTYLFQPDSGSERDLMRRGLDVPIVYRSSGTRQPIYEVAVPLFLGSKLKAVLDFEQFSSRRETLTPAQRGDLVRTARRERDRAGFLEWARAIALCIGFSEDLRDRLLKPTGGGSEAESEFAAFLHLAASMIANVPIPSWVIEAVELDLVGLLVPAVAMKVRSLAVAESAALEARAAGTAPVTSAGLVGPDAGVGPAGQRESDSQVCRLPIRHQGESRGLLEVAMDPGRSTGAEPHLFPYVPRSESIDMALRLLSAYKASLSSACTSSLSPRTDAGEREALEFSAWLRAALSVFERDFARLALDQEADAAALLRGAFGMVHGALQGTLGIGEWPGRLSHQGSDYCWYVYHAEVGKKGPVDHGWGNVLSCKLATELHLFVDTPELRNDEGKDSGPLPPRAPEGDGGSRDGRELWLSLLAETTYPRDDEDAGITSRAAATRKPQCYADVATSPYRSAETPALDRLFGRHPYSIISVPIVWEVEGSAEPECFGVINFLRRRDRLGDLRFFKVQDVQVAEKFVAGVVDCLREHLGAKAVRAAANASGGGLWPSAKSMVSEIEGWVQATRSRGRPSWVILETELAASDVELRQVLKERLPSFKDLRMLASGSDPSKLTATGGVNGKPCLMFFPLRNIGGDPREAHKRQILELTEQGPSLVIVAVTPGNRPRLEDMWPVQMELPDRIEMKEDPEENWQYALERLALHGAGLVDGAGMLHVLWRRRALEGVVRGGKQRMSDGSRIGRRIEKLLRSVRAGEAWRPYLQAVLADRASILTDEEAGEERTGA